MVDTGRALLSLVWKGGAARLIARPLIPVVQGTIKIRDDGRKKLEVRGRYRGASVRVTLGLVWGGAWVELRPDPPIDTSFSFSLSHDDDGRKAYEKKNADLDEWDKTSGNDKKLFIAEQAYFSEPDQRRCFNQLPDELQKAIVTVVEQDRYGKCRVHRDSVKVSVASRIHWRRNPAKLILSRLDLGADLIDEARRLTKTAVSSPADG